MAWAAIEPEEVNGVSPALLIGCSKAENQLCLEIPGCNQSKKDGLWRLPLTWPGYVSFKAVWSVQPISESDGLLAWAATSWAKITERMAARVALDASPALTAAITGLENGGELHLDPVQRGHAEWLGRWRRCILGDPGGNGKTPPVIRELQLLQATDEGCPALVIAPGSSLLSWARKLAAWAPELRVRVVMGAAGARRAALAAEADVYVIAWDNVRLHTRLASYQGQRFVVCNLHGGKTGKSVAACEMHEKELNVNLDRTGEPVAPRRWKTVIADECHRMANPKSKWSRAVQYLAHHAENFWAVTGTLTNDNVGDLWPVLHAIDPKAWPSRSRYLALWAVEEHNWFGKSYLGLRPDTSSYFHTAADPYFRRLPFHTGRPERALPEFRYPEMTHAQARLYRELQRDLMADLGDRDLVPDNGAVNFGRMVQVASSMIELTEGEDRLGFPEQQVKLKLPSNKADDLLTFLGDNDGQWIAYCYSPDLMDLCARKLDEHKIPHTRIVGGMGPVRMDEAAQAFQNHSEIRVIFINTAGGESIDLYAAEGVVFLQPNPSHSATEQIIYRADRRGQTKHTRIIYMIAPGTVDSRLYELSCEKSDRHQEITRDAELLRWVATEGELAGA
jgi:SNF2-related domain/Helicase conserved C-terminal domain